MRDSLKTLLGLLLIAGVGFVLGLGYGRKTAINEPETPIISKADTSSSVEPIEVERPKIKDSTVIHHVWVKVKINQRDSAFMTTLNGSDSVRVEMPIERKIYQEDSLYRAVVSGPRIGKAGPSLDSLLVFAKTTTITVTNTVPETVFVESRKRWSFGITAGPSVLATPSGQVHAGLGATIGLQYRF